LKNWWKWGNLYNMKESIEILREVYDEKLRTAEILINKAIKDGEKYLKKWYHNENLIYHGYTFETGRDRFDAEVINNVLTILGRIWVETECDDGITRKAALRIEANNKTSYGQWGNGGARNHQCIEYTLELMHVVY